MALKGSDGSEIQREALARGARKVSPERTVRALKAVAGLGLPLEFLTCSGEMGEEELRGAGIPFRIVYKPRPPTSRRDTVAAARAFVAAGAELVLFAGGDGTARDVLEAVGDKVPMLGIPTGVKMHSAVFLVHLEDLASVLSAFAASRETREAEVMDIDEESFRKGVLQAKLYGMAKVPDDRPHLQPSKQNFNTGGADEEVEEIGQYIADTMEEDVLYVLGPGSTTAAIAKALQLEKTMLGVDVVANRKLVLADATEQDLLRMLLPGTRARIIVTPIGAQGFLFGRGNQPISAAVIRRVGVENITVVASPTKLRHTPVLHTDTGDPELDELLRGRMKVVTGYKRRRLVEIR